MRRMVGLVLIVAAVIIVLLGASLSVQMVGHTEWWQPVALAILVLGVGFLLVRTGRRIRAGARS